MDAPSNVVATKDRLPMCIVPLDEVHRTAYILLRLRKSENQVAARLGISVEEALAVIRAIRHALAREGLLWHLEDPEFVPIHVGGPDGSEMQLAAVMPGAEEQAMAREVVGRLAEAVSRLSPPRATLLRLRYRNGLSAREICEFIARTGADLVPGKAHGDVAVSDVFYGVNAALKEVLGHLKRVYGDDCRAGIEGLKELLEEIGLDI